jgi:putative SOS response-associated peptidase YedK
MCGRFTETRPKSEIVKRFNIQKDQNPDFKTRYNIAPSQDVPVVLKKDLTEFHGFHWGLIPSWAKDASIGHHMINARAETITEKMSFKVPFKWRRCLVIADGFYEWKEKGGAKVPLYIQRKDHALFAFAGLWSHWVPKVGGEIFSCTIITTDANDWMKAIHDRIPVILPKESEHAWIDPNTNEQELLKLLKPCGNEELTSREVSKKVNDPTNDYPELLE